MQGVMETIENWNNNNIHVLIECIVDHIYLRICNFDNAVFIIIIIKWFETILQSQKRKHCKPTHTNHVKWQTTISIQRIEFQSFEPKQLSWKNFSIFHSFSAWKQNQTEQNRSLLLFESGQLLIGTIVVFQYIFFIILIFI